MHSFGPVMLILLATFVFLQVTAMPFVLYRPPIDLNLESRGGASSFRRSAVEDGTRSNSNGGAATFWFPRVGRANGISNFNSATDLSELMEAKRRTVFPRVGRAQRPLINFLLEKDLYMPEDFEEFANIDSSENNNLKSRTDNNILH